MPNNDENKHIGKIGKDFVNSVGLSFEKNQDKANFSILCKAIHAFFQPELEKLFYNGTFDYSKMNQIVKNLNLIVEKSGKKINPINPNESLCDIHPSELRAKATLFYDYGLKKDPQNPTAYLVFYFNLLAFHTLPIEELSCITRAFLGNFVKAYMGVMNATEQEEDVNYINISDQVHDMTLEIKIHTLFENFGKLCQAINESTALQACLTNGFLHLSNKAQMAYLINDQAKNGTYSKENPLVGLRLSLSTTESIVLTKFEGQGISESKLKINNLSSTLAYLGLNNAKFLCKGEASSTLDDVVSTARAHQNLQPR